MTTGKKLKKNLGLEKLKNVKVSRVAVSSYKILQIFYDSRRPSMPVTNYRIKNFPFVARVFHGTDIAHNTRKLPVMTPAIDIEDYNGTIKGSLIIPTDLAGDRFVDKNNYSKFFEKEEEQKLELKYQFNGCLKEYITLADLKDKGNISDFSMKWRKDRNRIMKGENITAKLIDCVVDEADKSVTFQFLTKATELGNKEPNDNIDSDYRFYTEPKGKTDPPNTWNIKKNRSKTYEIQIKILNFFDWLDVFEGEKIGRKEINEILEVSNIQISSTAPSFYWQGMAWYLTQIDASIYPVNIKPQFWNKPQYHGDNYFTDKHTYGILRQISFFTQQMGSKLTGKLQKRGLI